MSEQCDSHDGIICAHNDDDEDDDGAFPSMASISSREGGKQTDEALRTPYSCWGGTGRAICEHAGHVLSFWTWFVPIR